MKPILILLLTVLAISDSESWVYDFDEALLLAQNNNKTVLMVFAGSDWCIPCKKFEKTILSNADFESFQENNLVILYLDFPAKKKNRISESQKLHNEGLAEKYNPSGVFPKVLLLSSDGDVLKDIKFKNQNVLEFIQLVKIDN